LFNLVFDIVNHFPAAKQDGQRQRDWRRRTSGALDVVLQYDVGEGEDEVQDDDDGDEDAPLFEGVPAERGCAADRSKVSGAISAAADNPNSQLRGSASAP